MARIIVDALEFSHHRTPILKGINITIEPGTVIGILGQNGSGKTTLLNCIRAEYTPTAGTVSAVDFSEDAVDDKRDLNGIVDIRRFTERERSRIMAIVEQNSLQTFPFTVTETVMMGRYARTGIFEDNDSDIAYDCMEETGVIGFADRNVNELSGGEWRRVMIAQALAQEPEVLLLDEPTLHLDVNHQFELMDLCKHVAATGRAVAVVTHDLEIAARYCDKIAVMDHGKIISVGTPEETITTDMIRRIFHMESKVGYDPDLNGIAVKLIRRADSDE